MKVPVQKDTTKFPPGLVKVRNVGLGILFSFFRHSVRLRRSKDPFRFRLSNLMLVALTSIVLLSITTEPMRYPTGIWHLFALGSVVRVQYRQLKHRLLQQRRPDDGS